MNFSAIFPNCRTPPISLPLPSPAPPTCSSQHHERLHRSVYCSMLMICLVISAGAHPMPFDQSKYPSIDLRLLDWPLAVLRFPETVEQFSPLDCYTQLDRSFVDASRLYRLNSTGQLQHRACMLRIPTGTRITLHSMHTPNAKSYVAVMAGSSQVFMPVWTGHIHKDRPDMFGPWHVPCKHAYLVFNSKGSDLQWVQFRLSEETEQDRRAANPADCNTEGAINHVDSEKLL